jgi:hypothetical protein
MNVRKFLGGLIITLCIVCAAFGQQLKLTRSGDIVRVAEGRKNLYRVVLRGRANERGRKFDEAFLAGRCLIVRRDIRQVEAATEVYPDVSRLEIYRPNGKKRIYHEANLAISRINDWDLINSPDFTWAIVPDAGEADFSGYFHISEDCRISEVSFFPHGSFDWGSKEDGIFIDAATLKFPALFNRPSNGEGKKKDIFISKDGKFRFEDIN